MDMTFSPLFWKKILGNHVISSGRRNLQRRFNVPYTGFRRHDIVIPIRFVGPAGLSRGGDGEEKLANAGYFPARTETR